MVKSTKYAQFGTILGTKKRPHIWVCIPLVPFSQSSAYDYCDDDDDVFDHEIEPLAGPLADDRLEQLSEVGARADVGGFWWPQ